jgi:CubicO group peptidase (beta-lactamase class C family)
VNEIPSFTKKRTAPSGLDFEPVHAVMRRYVEEDMLAGLSSALLHGGELVDLHCVGWADREAGVALDREHLFRIFSNTKLITSCAVLRMMEDGRVAAALAAAAADRPAPAAARPAPAAGTRAAIAILLILDAGAGAV